MSPRPRRRRPKLGRRPKLTPALQSLFLAALARGKSRPEARQEIGIGARTLDRAMRHSAFLKRVTIAEASLRTPDARDKILGAIAIGTPTPSAYRWQGFTEQSFMAWLEADRDLASEIVKKEAGVEPFFLSKIVTAANKGIWTAAAWILERRFPDVWALRQRLEHSAPGGGPVEHAVQFYLPRNGREIEMKEIKQTRAALPAKGEMVTKARVLGDPNGGSGEGKT